MTTLTTAWISLIIAGCFEMVWAVSMKYSEGFSRLTPSVISVIAMLCSFGFLTYAIKHIPLGTAYAIWVGIGAVAIALFGMIWFKEPATLARVICIALIVVGLVGLKLLTPDEI